MKIADIELFPIRHGSVHSIATASADQASLVHSVVVRIQTDSGIVGLGEAVPSFSAHRGNIGGLMDTLRLLVSAVKGADASNVNGIQVRFDDASNANLIGCQEARSAIVMAILDVIGKTRGVPVHAVMGGSYRTEMETIGSMSEIFPEACANRSQFLVENGAAAVKVDLGKEMLVTDEGMGQAKDKLLAVLRAVGSEVQVYAQGSWKSTEQVKGFVASVLSDHFYSNLSVQQPLHSLDLEGHAVLRETLPIPVVLDESVESARAMMQILRLAAADRIVLDANRVGGLIRAKQIIDICDSATVGVSIGGWRGTRLGLTAHAHLASTVRDPLPIDVGSESALANSPFSGGFEMRDGRLILGNEPGLGIVLNEEELRSSIVEV